MVVLRLPETPDVLYIKRVAAVPGDEVAFTADTFTVNGREMDIRKRAPSRETNRALVSGKTFRLGPDQYFVLGDNPDHSQDSRHYGPIGRKDILGRPLYIYWSDSLGRIGTSF